MYELRGKYGEATVFSNSYNDKASSQIIELLNEEWTKDLNIKIMPDFHAGAGCVIGTTMNIEDKVVPNLVGVDIGCGMYVVNLGQVDLNLEDLDNYIRKNIPYGQDVNTREDEFEKLYNLRCFKSINLSRAKKSIGSLGGGNHFIEIDIAENGDKYLVIHSGSRYLGKQVADHYQEKAFQSSNYQKEKIKETIEFLKSKNRSKEIEYAISVIKRDVPKVKKALSYVEGDNFKDYIHDMKIVQEYASLNRKKMAERIIRKFDLNIVDQFETIHNYINTGEMVLRKGAISAKLGEKVIIPMNMRDGCIIALGKGNVDWNMSAPHGAGRIMSRGQAKELVNLEEFEKSMKDVYSTSVNESTIDESPMAYKPMQEIIDNVRDTVEIIEIIKPIYNFKA